MLLKELGQGQTFICEDKIQNGTRLFRKCADYVCGTYDPESQCSEEFFHAPKGYCIVTHDGGSLMLFSEEIEVISIDLE